MVQGFEGVDCAGAGHELRGTRLSLEMCAQTGVGVSSFYGRTGGQGLVPGQISRNQAQCAVAVAVAASGACRDWRVEVVVVVYKEWECQRPTGSAVRLGCWQAGQSCGMHCGGSWWWQLWTAGETGCSLGWGHATQQMTTAQGFLTYRPKTLFESSRERGGWMQVATWKVQCVGKRLDRTLHFLDLQHLHFWHVPDGPLSRAPSN